MSNNVKLSNESNDAKSSEDPMLNLMKSIIRSSNIKNSKNNMDYEFKINRSFEERVKNSSKLKKRHPGYVPIVIEKYGDRKMLRNESDEIKLMISLKDNLSNVITHLRNMLLKNGILSGDPKKAITLFINGTTLVPVNLCLLEIHDKYKDDDGFIYMNYCEEATFG